MALYDSKQHRSLAFLYGQDPGVLCLSTVAQVLWLLGYPDQAVKRSHEALTLAQDLSHPFSLVIAFGFGACWLHQYRREEQLVQRRAEVVIALSNERGFAYHLVWGTVLRAWALIEQGQVVEESLAQMLQGLATFQTMGVEGVRLYLLTLLAEAYGKAGQAEKGLTALTEALDLVNRTGERVYEAELYRLKGTLTLKQFGVGSSEFGVANPQPLTPNPQAEAEAEACFLKAVAIARQQEAKSLELRAATSLAYLWQRQGKQHAARNTLSEIYSWFTEGFDTVDLREAKALLRELSY
jgi:predicted ATPase